LDSRTKIFFPRVSLSYHPHSTDSYGPVGLRRATANPRRQNFFLFTDVREPRNHPNERRR